MRWRFMSYGKYMDSRGAGGTRVLKPRMLIAWDNYDCDRPWRNV